MSYAAGIVEGGHRRLRSHPETVEQLRQIEAELDERYRSRMEQAGFFGKLWLGLRKRRELERELEALAPKGGHYFAAGQNTVDDETTQG